MQLESPLITLCLTLHLLTYALNFPTYVLSSIQIIFTFLISKATCVHVAVYSGRADFIRHTLKGKTTNTCPVIRVTEALTFFLTEQLRGAAWQWSLPKTGSSFLGIKEMSGPVLGIASGRGRCFGQIPVQIQVILPHQEKKPTESAKVLIISE